MNILVVDDEEYILDELVEAISEDGNDVMSANSVDKAIDILRDNLDIKLLITDIKMPIKLGTELIHFSMREFPDRHKFIIMTGHGDVSNDLNSVELNGIPVFIKPIDLDEVLAFIKVVEKKVNSEVSS
ncbi:MAG: response regulator [Gammaproteobacteria bacterium]|nr:response regulator [Gammaproteobacteria bacterium]